MGYVLNERLQQRPSNDARLDALINLKIAASVMKGLEEAAYAKFDMTIAQFNVLKILRGVHPDGHPRYEITKRMVEPAADITRLIDRLEKKNLVKRDRTGVDRRLAIHRITPKGLALLDKMLLTKESFLGYLEHRLSKKECEALSALCEKIYADSD